jgi:hypothetical protein
MNWTTHVLYLIIILSLSGLVSKHQDNSKKYEKDYYELYDEYLDMQLEDNKAMKGWSLCLSEKASETLMRSKCDNDLWELRDWLRKCKCKCTGFEGK